MEVPKEFLEHPEKFGKFVPDDRLVKLVATRQSGDPLKGIRELIQNAWDANDYMQKVTGIIPPPVEIKVYEKDAGLLTQKSVFVFSDSGIGWGSTPEEFYEKMRLLGAQWKNGEFRGDFGLGRGQALGMIYDPKTDNYNGTISITTIIKGKPWTIDSFFIRGNDVYFKKPEQRGKKTLGRKKWGTEWTIVSNKPYLFDHNEIKEYIKDNIKGEYSIKLNDEVVTPELKGKKIPIKDAIIYLVPGEEGFTIYNRGPMVATMDIFRGWGGDILMLKSLETSLSRGEILEGSPLWVEIKEAVTEKVANEIDIMEKFTDSQARGIVRQMFHDKIYSDRWMDKRFIPLSDGKKITLRELLTASGMNRAFIGENTKIHSEANDQGWAVVDKEFLTFLLNHIILNYYNLPEMRNAETAEEFLEIKTKGYKEYKSMTKEEQLASKLLEKIIEESGLAPRSVRWGYTSDRLPPEAWTNGRDKIWFSRKIWKDVIKDIEKGGAGQLKAIMALAPTLIHEMTHDSDTRSDLPHKTEDFYEKQLKVEEKILSGIKGLFRDDSLFTPVTEDYEKLTHDIRMDRARETLEKEVL